jgi:hypothetical protein
MKISKEDFEQMKAKYNQEVKKGKPGKDKNREIDNQTDWISYTKEDLMEVLNQEGVTGIKFHFTEYTQKVSEEFYGDEADLYVGRLGLVYSPLFDSSESTRSANLVEDEYYDKGATCPPSCQ